MGIATVGLRPPGRQLIDRIMSAHFSKHLSEVWSHALPGITSYGLCKAGCGESGSTEGQRSQTVFNGERHLGAAIHSVPRHSFRRARCQACSCQFNRYAMVTENVNDTHRLMLHVSPELLGQTESNGVK
jgi:hypothetical protein